MSWRYFLPTNALPRLSLSNCVIMGTMWPKRPSSVPAISDDQVLKLAAAAGRVLITDDQGFGELAVRYGQAALGVIILSLYGLPAGVRERYAADQIAALANRIDGHLAIVEPGRVRLRPLPGRENN